MNPDTDRQVQYRPFCAIRLRTESRNTFGCNRSFVNNLLRPTRSTRPPRLTAFLPRPSPHPPPLKVPIVIPEPFGSICKTPSDSTSICLVRKQEERLGLVPSVYNRTREKIRNVSRTFLGADYFWSISLEFDIDVTAPSIHIEERDQSLQSGGFFFAYFSPFIYYQLRRENGWAGGFRCPIGGKKLGWDCNLPFLVSFVRLCDQY